MPSLRDLQTDFSRALLGGPEQAIVGAVLHDRLAPGQRVQIYRNHLRITLRDALATTFPVIVRLVGEAYFAAVARSFIEQLPPRAPVLAEYGANFPEFLASAPNAPVYLPDVARLEWALNAAYHADDAPVLTAAHLATLSPAAQAELTLAPLASTAVLRSAYPILAIWQANQPGQDAPGQDVTVDQGGQAVLVWRDDGDTACRALSPGEAALLQALLAGDGLGDAAALAVQAEPDLPLPAVIAALLTAPIFAAP